MQSVDQFEQYRPLMFSIAYRMLGSAMEAEDMVQEAYLRYQNSPTADIQSPKAFLSTIVTRLCLNHLELARTKRESYVGEWLPEPVITHEAAVLNPANQISLHESLSMAFLVLLESLTPLERAVFLLREVFEYEYGEIAAILDKEETACRQLFSRAKKHIHEHRPRFKPTPEAHHQLLGQFMQVVGAGELDGLMKILAQDVTLWADGGGKARGAATRPLHGREAVAQFMLASTRLPQVDYRGDIAEINGEPALVLRAGEKTLVVIFIEIAQDEITTVRIIGNPDKLQRV